MFIELTGTGGEPITISLLQLVTFYPVTDTGYTMLTLSNGRSVATSIQYDVVKDRIAAMTK